MSLESNPRSDRQVHVDARLWVMMVVVIPD